MKSSAMDAASSRTPLMSCLETEQLHSSEILRLKLVEILRSDNSGFLTDRPVCIGAISYHRAQSFRPPVRQGVALETQRGNARLLLDALPVGQPLDKLSL